MGGFLSQRGAGLNKARTMWEPGHTEPARRRTKTTRAAVERRLASKWLRARGGFPRPKKRSAPIDRSAPFHFTEAQPQRATTLYRSGTNSSCLAGRPPTKAPQDFDTDRSQRRLLRLWGTPPRERASDRMPPCRALCCRAADVVFCARCERRPGCWAMRGAPPRCLSRSGEI